MKKFIILLLAAARA